MPEFSPDSVAFITGAASGIGQAVSLRLLHDGVQKIAILDLSAEHLSTTLSLLTSISPSAKILQIAADCSVEAEVEAAVTQTVEKFGRLDFCFNAAGRSGSPGRIEGIERDVMESVLDLNLKGVWYCERAQIRQMMKQELRDVSTGLPLTTRGSIVNVGSMASHFAIPNIGPYIMSKHAVLGLCRVDAVDYAKEGIRVNCLCPGWIKTAMTKPVWENPIRSDAFIARAPMARWGLPEEVAFTVSFLLSDKASFITGASIEVDGGYSAC